MLTGECDFVSKSTPLSQRRSVSRDLGTLPPSFADFRRMASRVVWENIYCVAGTEQTDTKRVVVLYRRDMKCFMIYFTTRKKLTENEKAIKSWFERNVS